MLDVVQKLECPFAGVLRRAAHGADGHASKAYGCGDIFLLSRSQECPANTMLSVEMPCSAGTLRPRK